MITVEQFHTAHIQYIVPKYDEIKVLPFTFIAMNDEFVFYINDYSLVRTVPLEQEPVGIHYFNACVLKGEACTMYSLATEIYYYQEGDRENKQSGMMIITAEKDNEQPLVFFRKEDGEEETSGHAAFMDTPNYFTLEIPDEYKTNFLRSWEVGPPPSMAIVKIKDYLIRVN